MVGLLQRPRMLALALAWAVIAQAAQSSDAICQPDCIETQSIATDDVDVQGSTPIVQATTPTIGSRADSPASEGLLRERTSAPGFDFDQSNSTFAFSTRTEATRARFPDWLPQAGARPTYAGPSIQILFCTWLA